MRNNRLHKVYLGWRKTKRWATKHGECWHREVLWLLYELRISQSFCTWDVHSHRWHEFREAVGSGSPAFILRQFCSPLRNNFSTHSSHVPSLESSLQKDFHSSIWNKLYSKIPCVKFARGTQPLVKFSSVPKARGKLTEPAVNPFLLTGKWTIIMNHEI